jgi:hypothetical protein
VSRNRLIVVPCLAALSLAMFTGCGTTSRISIYDRFRESTDGSVTDIVTGLQWRVGPDRDFDWYGANIWISNLEGDWRMPTLEELEDLFDAGVTTETWGPFDNSGWLVWCVDFSSRDMAQLFCFIPDNVYFGAHFFPSGQRVFAVLSPSGYGTVAGLSAFCCPEAAPTYMPQLDPI